MYIKKTDPESFQQTASNCIKDKLATLLQTKEKINVALAGGNTPMPILNLLSKENLDWSKINFYQTDERLVSIDDKESNFHNLSKAFFSHIESKAYPMFPGKQSPENACYNYIKALKKISQKEGVPCLDLVVLGMGEDGHIASLFPGSRLLGEKQKLVMLDPVKRKGSLRMTLSLSMLTHALETVLLASGSEKINLLASKSARTNLPINQLIENNTNITVICTED